jgi:hypothetical protein
MPRQVTKHLPAKKTEVLRDQPSKKNPEIAACKPDDIWSGGYTPQA